MKRYAVRLTVSITQEEMERLTQLAEQAHVSIAHVVRAALRAYQPETGEDQ